MLVSQAEKYERVAFADDAEIEKVVQTYAEELFGSSILFLPQAKIGPVSGRGSAPDAVVVDVEIDEWYVVETERAVHGTWEHIAPLVSRRLAALSTPGTAAKLIEAALTQLRGSAELRSMMQEAGVSEAEVHGRLQAILRKPPVIALPIDGLPKDLAGWAQTLRNDVQVWVIEKYVSTADPSKVLYSLPDDGVPTISTKSDNSGTLSEVQAVGAQPYQELLNAMPELVGQTVKMEFGSRGGKRRTFEGVLRSGGIEVDGEVKPLSSAALHCLKKAGSARKTVNGWTSWRTTGGKYLMELYWNLGTVEAKEEAPAAAVAVASAA